MPRGIDRDEQRERDRQREADRLASEANPPKPVDVDPCEPDYHTPESRDFPCPMGTFGCSLKHDGTDPPKLSYAEGLKASNERVKTGETKSHWTGD